MHINNLDLIEKIKQFNDRSKRPESILLYYKNKEDFFIIKSVFILGNLNFTKNYEDDIIYGVNIQSHKSVMEIICKISNNKFYVYNFRFYNTKVKDLRKMITFVLSNFNCVLSERNEEYNNLVKYYVVSGNVFNDSYFTCDSNKLLEIIK